MKLFKSSKLNKKYSQAIMNLWSNKTNPGTLSFDKQVFSGKSDFQYDNQKISTSKLENGVTIITENTSLPSQVNMGILLNIGNRDENSKNSGALHSIQTTYYKSFAFTNETINYGMVQMSGGNFNMNFDRENMWYTSSCLAHDTIDIFNMMADCSLEPRNFNSTSVAMSKLPHSLKQKQASNQWNSFSDKVFQSIYGKNGLGNLLFGNEKNYEHLDSLTMQEFQLDHISPEKIVVCGLGVQNHGEFHEIVEQKMHNLFYNQNTSERTPSQFFENDVRIPCQGKSEFVIAFESGNISSKNILNDFLLSHLLGQVEVNEFDVLKINQGNLYKNIYLKEKYALGMEARNYHYSDSGFFSLRGVVSGNNVNNMIEKMAQEFNGVQKLSESQFETAKKRLVLNIQQNLSQGQQRVTEFMKQQSNWNTVMGEQILEKVQSITLTEFKKYVSNLGKSKMCFVLQTPDVNSVLKYDKIKGLFK